MRTSTAAVPKEASSGADLWEAGIRELVCVIPPKAELSPLSRINPKSRGKVPGQLNREGKWTGSPNWQTRVATAEDVAAWDRDGANIGALGRHWPAYDLDLESEFLRDAVVGLVKKRIGGAVERTSRGSRYLMAYPAAEPGAITKHKVSFIFEGVEQAVELLGDGNQWVAAGEHPSGSTYRSRLTNTEHPGLTLDDAQSLLGEIAELIVGLGGEILKKESSGKSDRNAVDQDSLRGDVEVVGKLVAAMPNNLETREEWIRFGAALKGATQDDPEAGFDIWSEWCGRWSGGSNTPEEIQEAWVGLKPPFALGLDYLRRVAGVNTAVYEFDPVCGRPEGSEADAEAEEKRDRQPTIHIRAYLNPVTDEAIDAIANRPDLGVFVRGRMLVTVGRDGTQEDNWLHRAPGSPVIVPLEATRMKAILDDAAEWLKWGGGREWVPALPPHWVAQQIMGRLDWPFPYLEAVTEVPTMRPDGTILDTPGYDPKTALLYEPPPFSDAWPGVPENPSKKDALKAAEVLLDVAANFPFVRDSDRSAYVAAILSLIGRHLIDGPIPLFAVRAPTPGTGKSLLVNAMVLMGTGRESAVMSEVGDSEELRKRVTSLVLAGTPCVNLDNVSGTLGSDVLAAALTSSEWEDRILGRSEMVRLPNRLVWFATGNNFGFRKTLGRRVVPIDMDAQMESPEDRTEFQYPDLVRHIGEHRLEYVAAALTILRAFHLSGRPHHGNARMGSFEAWDDLIRSAVTWIGLEDPAGTDEEGGRGRIRAQADDDLDTLSALLGALARVFPDGGEFTAQGAIEQGNSDTALRRDLEPAASDPKSGKLTITSLGYALRDATNRPVGEYTLRAVEGKRPRKYSVEVRRKKGR